MRHCVGPASWPALGMSGEASPSFDGVGYAARDNEWHG